MEHAQLPCLWRKVIFNERIGESLLHKFKNREIIWTVDLMKDYDGRNIKWAITENLLIDDNKLFCTPGGVEANVIALDKNTGKLIWKSKGNGELSAYCSPALIKLPQRHILATMTESSILGIDTKNGNVLWRQEHTNKYSVHPNTPSIIMAICIVSADMEREV